MKNGKAQFRFFCNPAVAPSRLAGYAPHKNGGRRVKSWPDDTHLQPFTPVIWAGDLCHKQQTSIRCNHTHWVYLKCTQIKQRQYKSDIWSEQTQHTYSLEDHTQIIQQKRTQPKKKFKEKTFTSPTHIANAFNKQFTNTVKHK